MPTKAFIFLTPHDFLLPSPTAIKSSTIACLLAFSFVLVSMSCHRKDGGELLYLLVTHKKMLFSKYDRGKRYVMCILFIKLLKAAKNGEFKFILASNRDEFFKRPAKPAHFWEEDSNIIGGRDMTKGKEGGTWLAMSKKGKLAVLLNVSSERVNPEKRGRGFLVADYLKNSLSIKESLEKIKESSEEYNKFHFLTALLGHDPKLFHYSNETGNDITEIQTDKFALSNSSVKNPFMKVVMGENKFEEICKNFGRVDKKEELVKELLNFLKWDRKHYPDEVIDSIANISSTKRSALSSIFVNVPGIDFGTRTHTIIVVDWKDNVDFYEWALVDPITPEHMEWRQIHHSFQIVAAD